MTLYRFDLHIHSVASHCYGGPRDGGAGIIAAAQAHLLSLIAVTDHHSVRGVKAVQAAARGTGITVLPGMELTCRVGSVDEVFLLAVFPEEFPLRDAERQLEDWRVPEGAVGSGGYVMEVSVEQVLKKVRAFGGLVLSARADKTAFRRQALPHLLEAGVTLFDLVHRASEHTVFAPLSQDRGQLHFFTFSDAHAPSDIGERFCERELFEPSFDALLAVLLY